MPIVIFAPHLQRHVQCPPQHVPAESLRAVLDVALKAAPNLRPYVLDEQGHIRKHVAVFINNQMHVRRHDLSIMLTDNDEVHVIQALSGG